MTNLYYKGQHVSAGVILTIAKAQDSFLQIFNSIFLIHIFFNQCRKTNKDFFFKFNFAILKNSNFLTVR